MEELQATLQSVLSDPARMAQIAALAESLGLKPPEETPASPVAAAIGRQSEATGQEIGNRESGTGDGRTGPSASLRFAQDDKTETASPVGAATGRPPNAAASPVGAATGRPPNAAASPVGAATGRPPEAPASQIPFPIPDGLDLGRLMTGLSAMQGRENQVLGALRPSLGPSGQAKADRALRAAKLARLAGQLLRRGREGHV
ncbi:MAG: hypothetical protein IKQ04_01080 [Oscillospiraceae bacterium]|nr:hypothetical protein [Oscillospiraceae bacterium]